MLRKGSEFIIYDVFGKKFQIILTVASRLIHMNFCHLLKIEKSLVTVSYNNNNIPLFTQ